MIKSLTRLPKSSNSKCKCKQHSCMNCLQGFHSEESRNEHSKYNEAVKIKMPQKGSVVKFHDGQTSSRCHLSCMQT